MGLTNNDIFKKLRVAHKLRDDDIVKICALVDFKVTKSELKVHYGWTMFFFNIYFHINTATLKSEFPTVSSFN